MAYIVGADRYQTRMVLLQVLFRRIRLRFTIHYEIFPLFPKVGGSLDICYNVQSVVDAKNHFVVDISTTNDINDQNQLYTMAQKASELLGKEFLKNALTI